VFRIILPQHAHEAELVQLLHVSGDHARNAPALLTEVARICAVGSEGRRISDLNLRRNFLNSISWEPVKRYRFAPGSEPKMLIGNLCEVYEIKCAARGGVELCPGHRECDPEIMDGGKTGATVWCICECHRQRARPRRSYRP
jgi:hypothetical protein